MHPKKDPVLDQLLENRRKKTRLQGKRLHTGLYIKKKGTPSFSFRCQDIIKIKWSLGGFKIRYIKREVIYKM